VNVAEQERRNSWSDGWLPWVGSPRVADRACWFGISLSGLYYLALIPAKPWLLGRQPVLLELLSGSTSSIVTAAAFARIGRVLLALAVAAALPGLMKFDPLYWWAGRLWGRRAIELFTGRSPRPRA
jgi:hypothetical protein